MLNNSPGYYPEDDMSNIPHADNTLLMVPVTALSMNLTDNLIHSTQ
jgi:hypothetical protein